MNLTKFLATAVAVALGSLALTSYTNAVTVTAGTGPNYIDTEGNVFEMGSLTITSGDVSITILDRNLGATQTGITCPDYNSGACGYIFQWGNNYGFGNPLTKTGTTKVDTSGYSRANPYVSDTFIQQGTNNWSSINNANLRGGAGDTTSSRQNPDYMRQGPCPEGYHVPTYAELNTLKTLAGNNGNTANTNFFIPFAGGRGNLSSLGFLGEGAYLWSSSPNSSNARSLILISNGNANMNGNLSRAYAFSLRCVKDTDTNTSILSINTKGGQRMQGQSVPTGGTGHTPGYEPKKAGAIFDGWYKDEGYTIPFDFKTDIISQNTTIYAKWGHFVEPTDSNTQVTVGQTVYNELPNTMTVTINNEVNVEEDKPVVGEVSVSFGSNESAKFSKLVKVNVPVEDANRVIIKVKHARSEEYNFDGLTKNKYANCDANGRPASSQYNGEAITVVNGFATIYTCEASSFIAVGEGPLSAQIVLSVNKGELTIGTETGNLNLGQVNVSNSSQELSGSFGADSFWVEDMKGVESGYYTTISVTDLTGSVASHVISANNISLKTAGNAPTNISGATANEAKVIFGEGITSWHSGSTPVNYFQRLNTAVEDAGRVGKWGDNLQIKVNIPAHTPSDIYRGTITYTLYDNDL